MMFIFINDTFMGVILNPYLCRLRPLRACPVTLHIFVGFVIFVTFGPITSPLLELWLFHPSKNSDIYVI